MVARPWSSSCLSCGDDVLLRCNGNDGNSFPTKQGKDPSSRALRQKRGSPGCAREPRASSRVETGMLGTFLSCGKCVKDLLELHKLGVISLEKPQRKCASSRLQGKTSWIFSSFGRCSRLMTGTSGTHSGGLRKGPSPCEFLGVSRDCSPVDARA